MKKQSSTTKTTTASITMLLVLLSSSAVRQRTSSSCHILLANAFIGGGRSSSAAATRWTTSTTSSSRLFASTSSTPPKAASSTTTTGTSDDESNILDFPEFTSKEEYETFLSKYSKLPQGFKCGTASGTFVPVEAPMMGPLPIKGTIIALDEPTDSWAACFTKNKFPGAPIKVGRQRLSSGKPLQALVINNKVSNVCSGGNGVEDSELVCEAVANSLDLPLGSSSVLPSSTGVIGWNLPAKELAEDVVPKAAEGIAMGKSDTAFEAAEAIMTTDRFPKVRSWTLTCGARVVGIAKGAGMIEPNMATMLSYIMTDATIPQTKLQTMLSNIVNQSYNSISVDGDESTSDTVALVSSNKVDGTDLEEFELALGHVCRGLAADIVRNGEGTGHVIRVKVTGYPGTDHDARKLGRHVVNSPLFKCAVSGNDPNTGRLAGAIGSFIGKLDNADIVGDEDTMDGVTLTLGGRTICENGKFILEGDDVERELSEHMAEAQYDEVSDYPPHQKFVEVGIDFGGGNKGSGSATVLGSDLTSEYVSINADYRS